MELVCGPIRPVDVEGEIPFVCSLVANGKSTLIGVMYGVGCRIDQLWQEFKIPTTKLEEWISDGIFRGIYTPGSSDIYISDGDRLKVRLCHESDIHIHTINPAVVSQCVTRWLEMGYRIHRGRVSGGKGWKEVWSVEDAISALNDQPT